MHSQIIAVRSVRDATRWSGYRLTYGDLLRHRLNTEYTCSEKFATFLIFVQEMPVFLVLVLRAKYHKYKHANTYQSRRNKMIAL
jgi:hypothetical protein